MTAAVDERSFTSPSEDMSDSFVVHKPSEMTESDLPRHVDLPRQFSRAVVNNFKIRPIFSISLITPDPTKTAQTWMADASTSGYESEANAGVKAAAMGA